MHTHSKLWFAFIFLSLINQQQHITHALRMCICCDLLSFFYLWSISNSIVGCLSRRKLLWFAFIFLSLINQQQPYCYGNGLHSAVICFHFFIFDQSATARPDWHRLIYPLWFAFIFLSLINQQQPKDERLSERCRCDLLSFFYLWSISNSLVVITKMYLYAVICFHFFIFDQSATAFYLTRRIQYLLWFAFIFLSLINQQQQSEDILCAMSCCDLLSFFYLWSISNSCDTYYVYDNLLWFAFIFLSLINQQQQQIRMAMLKWAVICFHFFIFDQSATARGQGGTGYLLLWFAFIFLSLINQQQRGI